MISLGRLRRENIHKHHFHFYRSLAYFIIGLSSYWIKNKNKKRIRKNVKEGRNNIAGRKWWKYAKGHNSGKGIQEGCGFWLPWIVGYYEAWQEETKIQAPNWKPWETRNNAWHHIGRKGQAAWILFVFAIPSLLSQVLFFNLRINIIED